MTSQHVRSFLTALVAFLVSCCPSSGQPAKAAPTSTNESAACASLGDMLGELKQLRMELLGFYAVAKQEKTSDLERKINELRAQRERLDFEERRAIQYLAELDAQLGSANAEERERIQAEKASRGGPALEALRTRQSSLSRKEDDLRSLLASEQQRLNQIKQQIAEAGTPAGR
jgi:chromosome segregation ATPase